MFQKRGQSGFTLVEVVVVITTVLILAGALLGLGRYLTIRSTVQLCQSQIGVVATALELYYDDYGQFPFTTDTGTDSYPAGGDGLDDYLVDDLLGDLLGGAANGALYLYDTEAETSSALSTGDELLDTDGNGDSVSYASSVSLFYFLDRSVNCRKIIEALSIELVTNVYDGDDVLTLRATDAASDGSEDVDLPRFVDPWGMSLRYEYLDGMAFPVLRSAGPDLIFDNADDVVSQ